MAEADPGGGTIAALTDKETEILRLLASGHTVKSIAAQLGRSEASINERLREARRKTGIGSSRELARLLDAQINRHRKIDLAGLAGAADQSAQRQDIGRKLPKGLIIMLVAISLAAAGYALTAPNSAGPAFPHAATAAAAAKSPLVGRWALDTSRIPAEERPKSVTITFSAGADNALSTNVEMVAPDGSVRTAQSTATPGGGPVAVSGTMDFIDSAAIRQPEPGTLVMTLGKNGKPVSTRVYTVSKDRKSMTETIIWAADGIPELETTYFTRVG